jgi:von Willebrand factor type A domain/Putative Flp pilus-assembly TadE/G-like
MSRRLPAIFSGFCRDHAGSMSTMFALTMTILMTTIGAGIDLGRGHQAQTTAAAVADASVLAALQAALEADKAGKTESQAKAAGLAAGQSAWAQNAANANLPVTGIPTFTISQPKTHEWKATIDFQKGMDTHFMSLFGQKFFQIKTHAEAASGFEEVKEFWDIHMAVDFSASMGIGATQTDINAMQADANMLSSGVTTGCAFACHYSSSNNDTMAYARTKGYKLRIDVVKDAINSVTTKLEAISDGSNVKMGLYGFSNNLIDVVAKTGTFSTVRSAALNLELTPGSAGNTNYRAAMEQLTTKAGSSGDGTTSSKAKKMAIIVTDGVHDTTTYEPNIYSQPVSHYYTGTMAPSFCDAMKNAGVKVGVLYVPYVIPTGYSGYVSGFYSTIPTKLQACASTDMYFQATNASQYEAMLTTLIKTAFGADSSLRLTQ